MVQAWHTCIWGSFPITLCRTVWELSARTGSVIVQPFFQLLPEIFTGVQVWALGHSATSALSWLCVFRSLSCLKVNLQPILRSWVFLSRISWIMSLLFDLFFFLSNPTCFPVPAAGKHSHSMRLLPPCLSIGMELSRWQTVPDFLHKSCKTQDSGQSVQYWFHQK